MIFTRKILFLEFRGANAPSLLYLLRICVKLNLLDDLSPTLYRDITLILLIGLPGK